MVENAFGEAPVLRFQWFSGHFQNSASVAMSPLFLPFCLATQVIASAHPFGGLAHSAPEFALHRSAMGPKSWLVNRLVSWLGVVCNIAVWLFGMFIRLRNRKFMTSPERLTIPVGKLW